MADNFEQAKDDVLFRTEKNGGPTPHDLMLLLSAKAKDDDIQHDESMAAIAKQGEVFAIHCRESEARITAIEAWKIDSETNCADRIKRLIHDEHSVIHAAHMAAEHVEEHPRRSGDVKGSDHVDERKDTIAAVVGPIEKKMWVLWGIFIFVAIEAGHTLVMWLIERAAGS